MWFIKVAMTDDTNAECSQGIDLDDLSNPYTASLASGLSFLVGAGNVKVLMCSGLYRKIIEVIMFAGSPSTLASCLAGVPLLAAAFIKDHIRRLISLLVASTAALLAFGAIGAWLGGANKVVAAARVLLGGWIAMAITYGFGALFASVNKSH
jgi:VIT1/CCC1 family predicted Fe2+/Mn2+ transporter